MSLASAFDAAQVRRCLDALTPPGGPVLVGYSGGGDSHALLLIAARWAHAAGRQLHAVIVDHGLRPESAGEVRRAASVAHALGVETRIHHETGANTPTSGIQDWARALRHHAFAAAARETGANAVLLGHTADDQAETVWMRLLAGGGDRALAAMSADDPFPGADTPDGFRVLRPLLGQRRAAIRDWLASQGENWVDDPSNADRAYTRVRIRQTLARLEKAGLSISALTGLSQACADLNTDIGAKAARLFARTVTLEPWGGAKIDRTAFAGSADRVQHRALEAAIAVVTGHSGPLRASGVEALMAGVAARRPASGAGAILHFRRDQAWLLRDPGAVLGREGIAPLAPVTVEAGSTRQWDGRFAVTNTLKHAVEIGCLAQLGPALQAQLPDLSEIPAPARQTLPVIHEGGTLLAIPGIRDDPRVSIVHKGYDLAQRSFFSGQAPAWFGGSLGQTVTQGSHYRG